MKNKNLGVCPSLWLRELSGSIQELRNKVRSLCRLTKTLESQPPGLPVSLYPERVFLKMGLGSKLLGFVIFRERIWLIPFLRVVHSLGFIIQWG
jgi:hypothetical protein